MNPETSGLLLLLGKNLAPTLLRGRSPDCNVGTVSLPPTGDIVTVRISSVAADRCCLLPF